MDASYSVIIARNVEDREINALRDILAKIHKKEVTWESIAKTTSLPLESAKKPIAPKCENCGEPVTAKNHKCKEKEADPPAGELSAKTEGEGASGTYDPESPKGRFLAVVLKQYKSDVAIMDQSIRFVEEFAKHVKKDVDYVYETALKQWDNFIGDFETWRISQPGADRDPGTGKDPAPDLDGKKPKKKAIKDYNPAVFNEWKGFRNKDSFEEFIMINKEFFEHPENMELYFKAKEKWHRAFGKDRDFPYPQVVAGGPGSVVDAEFDEGEADEPLFSEVLLGLFPPKLIEGDGDAGMLLGIRRALDLAEGDTVWSVICEEVQQETGITLDGIKKMRGANASYDKAYEYLSRVIDKGIDGELDLSALKVDLFNGKM